VTSAFDPFDPIGSVGRLWTRGSRDAKSWFDQWFDATSAWASAPLTPERLLGDMIDGLLARFAGRRLTVTVHGNEVSGVLDALRVSGPSTDQRAHAVLSDVEWRGHRLEEVVVRARQLRISPGLTATLTAHPVEIEGRGQLADALAWLATNDTGWTIDLDGSGALRAVHRDRPFRVGGTGAVADGKLEVEVTAVGYGDKGVRLPRWVRIVREIELPQLPPGMRLLDAHRIGDQVSFRVLVDDVKLDIDLERVRSAIMRGAAVPVA
jgi:hypothetical protein